MFTKHAPKLLVLLLALLITGGIIAAKAPAEPKQYDYVSLVQDHDVVCITQGTTKFKCIRMNSEGGTGQYNMEPLFIKVSEFEAQGYELVTSNVYAQSTSDACTYVLLRKPK